MLTEDALGTGGRQGSFLNALLIYFKIMFSYIIHKDPGKIYSKLKFLLKLYPISAINLNHKALYNDTMISKIF